MNSQLATNSTPSHWMYDVPRCAKAVSITPHWTRAVTNLLGSYVWTLPLCHEPSTTPRLWYSIVSMYLLMNIHPRDILLFQWLWTSPPDNHNTPMANMRSKNTVYREFWGNHDPIRSWDFTTFWHYLINHTLKEMWGHDATGTPGLWRSLFSTQLDKDLLAEIWERVSNISCAKPFLLVFQGYERKQGLMSVEQRLLTRSVAINILQYFYQTKFTFPRTVITPWNKMKQ